MPQADTESAWECDSVPVKSGAGRVLKGSGVSSDCLGTADRPPAGAGPSQPKAAL